MISFRHAVCTCLLCKRLLEEFRNHIEELRQLDKKIQRKVEKLEGQCHREAKEFAHKVQDLQKSNQVCCSVKKNKKKTFTLKFLTLCIVNSSFYIISGGLSALPGAR